MNIYGGLIQFCVWTTVFLTVAFALLVLRRWYTEHRAPVYKARQKSITHSYLRRAKEWKSTKPGLMVCRSTASALTHLLMLLRVGNRER